MPYERKNSAVWWVSYTDPSGKRVRKSTGTSDRKEAEALEAKWKLESYRSKQWDEQPVRTFDELMLRYLEEASTKKRSAERDRYSAKQLYQVFSGVPLDQISADMISGYKNKRTQQGVTDSTIAKELRLFSAATNYARREWGWDIDNPVQGRCPRESTKRIRWITEKEAESLMLAAKSSRAPWLVDFIELGLNTGMRSGEMLGLTWERVDLGTRLIYLAPEDQKNNSEGSVPINEQSRQVLTRRFQFQQEYCPESEFVFCNKEGNRIKSIKRSFKTACDRAGIKDFTPHGLRHTCAAWLVQNDVSIRKVAKLLRHRDIRTTMRYAHLSPDSAREAVKTLDVVRSHFGHSDSDETYGGGVSH